MAHLSESDLCCRREGQLMDIGAGEIWGEGLGLGVGPPGYGTH